MRKLPAAAGLLALTLAAACAPAGTGQGRAPGPAAPAGGPDATRQQQPENGDQAGPQPGRTRDSNRHARDRNERDQ
jgi:hypothetical protein